MVSLITNILDTVNSPEDIKNLSSNDLSELADNLREKLIEVVSRTGGHLGANLGVVELTIALHYIFDTPRDKIIWDVGHQSYIHKFLTGRKDKLFTLKQPGGISGFTKRAESEYDVFGAGHSSTSISAAFGFAKARDFNKEKHEVISVIGDGAISAGMAYEAMNNVAASDTKLIVILNDNKMSIAPAVGAMSNHLSKLVDSKPYLTAHNFDKRISKAMPEFVTSCIDGVEKNIKTEGMNFFEEMGFHYLGPVDGHDLESLIFILKNVRDSELSDKPFLIHVVTEKGRGFSSPNISSKENYHAVGKFDPKTCIQDKKNTPKTYSTVFVDSLIEIAAIDKKVIAITAAMTSGTGLDKFGQEFPDRLFDVGIAEQHAVTFSAGLACAGFKPFCAIYSTFLQRAYDQVIHDVVIQSLPVRFIIDRAGLVGGDGDTHAGSFDLAYLGILPNIVVMAPSTSQELCSMINTAYTIDHCPSAIRYPRGSAANIYFKNDNIHKLEILDIGKANIIKKGKDVAILSLGTRLEEVLVAYDKLKEDGYHPTVVDMRFLKPMDTSLIKELLHDHKSFVTVEEGSTGGFANAFMSYLNSIDMLSKVKVKVIHFPDVLLGQGDVKSIYEDIGLNAGGIVRSVQELLVERVVN